MRVKSGSKRGIFNKMVFDLEHSPAKPVAKLVA